MSARNCSRFFLAPVHSRVSFGAPDVVVVELSNAAEDGEPCANAAALGLVAARGDTASVLAPSSLSLAFTLPDSRSTGTAAATGATGAASVFVRPPSSSAPTELSGGMSNTVVAVSGSGASRASSSAIVARGGCVEGLLTLSSATR